MKKPEVVIIGSGLAGLTAGAFLAEKGAKVLILEELSQIGGRVRVLEKEGFILDYGLHLYSPKSPLPSLTEKLNKELVLLKDTRIFQAKEKALELVYDFFQVEDTNSHPAEPEWLKPVKEQNPEKWYKKSLKDFLARGSGLDEDLLMILARLFLIPEPKNLSAGELLNYLQSTVSAGCFSLQIQASIKVLLQALGDFISARSGEISLGHRAIALEVKGKKIQSIETSQGNINPQAVIYAGSISGIFKLVGSENLPEKITRKLKKAIPCSALAVDFALREKVSDIKGIILEPELGAVGKFPSNSDSSRAPEGKQLSSWLIPLPRNQLENPEAVRGALVKLRSKIRRLFPDFFPLVEWERILVLSEAFSLAPVPSQSLPGRLSSRSLELENLFLAGDSLAFAGRGTDIAVLSGEQAGKDAWNFLEGGEK